MQASDIERLSVHPAIGVARIGNAPDTWFLAPEVRGALPEDADGYRDSDGRIKRQAARFRLYAKLKSGEVREVTAEDGEITWRVQVANLKAGWYEFNYPMDLPEELVKPPRRRNFVVQGMDRAGLDIRPTPIEISGRGTSGLRYRFDDGTFLGKPVYLGEVRTDHDGRLLFLGGMGVSSHSVPGTRPKTFANNNGWHDDVSDGPVRAQLRIGDEDIEAEPAHVVVAPPNYAPGLYGIVTMDDVVRNLYARLGWVGTPDRPSFARDIWPFFDRLTGHQWVNDGIFLLAGQGTPLDARDPAVIARLGDQSQAGAEFRKAVFRLFRRSDPPEARPDALPPFYGDTTGDRLDPAREELLLTVSQYVQLEKWAQGNFDADWSGIPLPPTLDDIPPEERPGELDRAALFECLGGPFHPGIELTWPLRLESMWAALYRLKALPEGQSVEQDYGDTLSRKTALAADGPHGTSGPGSLTRWLGVPWQTDEASCNSGRIYAPSLFLSTPSFWGARVPNQVLPLHAYEWASDTSVDPRQRARHFSMRRHWTRDINGTSYEDRISNMVDEWWEIGLLTQRTPSKDSGLPDLCYVETGRSEKYTGDDATLDLLNAVDTLDRPQPPAGAPATAAVAPGVARPRRKPFRTFGRGEV